jgi:hypothetical protein
MSEFTRGVLIQKDDPEQIRQTMEFYLGGGAGNPLGVAVSIPAGGACDAKGIMSLDVSIPVRLQTSREGD